MYPNTQPGGFPQYQSGYNPPQAYPQIANPTLPQIGQIQQQPVQPAMPVRPIEGRVVSNLNEITAADVRNDGTICLFPTTDYSCIFAKQWGSNGLISTVKYVPATDDQSAEQVAVPAYVEDLMDQISDIKNTLNEMKHKQTYRQNKNWQKDKKPDYNDSVTAMQNKAEC